MIILPVLCGDPGHDGQVDGNYKEEGDDQPEGQPRGVGHVVHRDVGGEEVVQVIHEKCRVTYQDFRL